MSFELFIDSPDNAPGLTREELRQLFGVQPVEEEPDYWRLEFGSPQDASNISLHSMRYGPERIRAFTVWRPRDDSRLWKGLFTAMQVGQMFMYWPGDSPPLITSISCLVPAEIIEALGQPICLADWQEIRERIERS